MKKFISEWKYGVFVFIVATIMAIVLSSCTSTYDTWGNKQSRAQRKALNEMGCPGQNGYRSN